MSTAETKFVFQFGQEDFSDKWREEIAIEPPFSCLKYSPKKGELAFFHADSDLPHVLFHLTVLVCI